LPEDGIQGLAQKLETIVNRDNGRDFRTKKHQAIVL
jgi:hypothetical protein